jgi:zinc protease
VPKVAPICIHGLQRLVLLALGSVLVASPSTGEEQNTPVVEESAARSATTRAVSGASAFGKVSSYRLANGLEVRLQPDASKPRVGVALHFGVGWSDDPPDRVGLAHFVEHLFFHGSRHAPGIDFLKRFETAGVTELQGMTAAEHTFVVHTLPASNYATGLWLVSDATAFLLDRIDANVLEAERAVVRNENRVRDATLTRTASINLYPKGHPYRYEGDVDLDAIELDELRFFFQYWYGPNNATLALVGDFDVNEARARIERYFASIRNSGPRPPHGPRSVVASRAGSDRRVRSPLLTRDRVLVTWVTPGRFQAGEAELELVARHLEYGDSPLRRLIDRGMIETFSVSLTSADVSGTLRINAIPHFKVDADAVLAAIESEIAALRAWPLPGSRFDLLRAKAWLGLVNRIDQLSSRALHLSQFPWPLEFALSRLNALSAEGVRSTAARVLVPENRLRVRFDRAPQP